MAVDPPAGLEPLLVLGIGNPLRGDDGVGLLLAEQAALSSTAGEASGSVVVRWVQQLTPELALDLANRQAVLFIDAALPLNTSAEAQASLETVEPCAAAGPLDSHRLEPAQLLAISALLYGRRPQAALLRVPAAALGHGTALSPALRARLPLARRLLQQWLRAQAGAAEADPLDARAAAGAEGDGADA